MVPNQSVSRRPTREASAPPVKEPSGITPHTMKRLRRIQATEHAVGGDRLLEGDAGDVEDDAAEGTEEERGNQERNRL